MAVLGDKTQWSQGDLNQLADALATVAGGSLSAIGDITINSDSDGSGAGDIVLQSNGVEWGRMTAAGVSSGLFSYFPKIWDAVYADVTVSNTARAAINLRFDDGYATDYTVVFPELRSRNLPGSLGMVSSFLDGSGKCTTAQVLEMQQAGIEICCHSKTHLTAPANRAAFIDEVINSQVALRAAQFQADAFIQPGTWASGPYMFDAAAKVDSTDAGWNLLNNYAAACAYIQDDSMGFAVGVRTIPTIRRYASVGIAIDTMTLAQAKAQLDIAITYGGSKQFYIHSSNIGQATFMTLADFQAFLDYVKLKRDAGVVELLSVCGLNRAAAGTSRNYINDGTFAQSVTGTPVSWIQQVGSGWTIDVGQGAGGTSPGANNAAKVNSANYLWQPIAAKNIRSFRVISQVKNAVAGAASTARVGVWQFNASNVQIGASYTRLFTCADAYQTFDAPFGIRPDCDYFYVGIFASTTAFVHYSNVQMKKI